MHKKGAGSPLIEQIARNESGIPGRDRPGGLQQLPDGIFFRLDIATFFLYYSLLAIEHFFFHKFITP